VHLCLLDPGDVVLDRSSTVTTLRLGLLISVRIE